MAELEKNIMDEKNEKAAEKKNILDEKVKMTKAKTLVSSIVKAKLAEKEENTAEQAAAAPEAAEAGADDAAPNNFVDGAISQAQKIKSLEK